MANGPLTPPPTTAAELQDEARSVDAGGEVPAVAPQTASVQAPAQDIYQRIFPAISELATQSNFEDLINTAESSDLNVQSTHLQVFCAKCSPQSDGDRQNTRLLVTTPLVLAYLILDNM